MIECQITKQSILVSANANYLYIEIKAFIEYSTSKKFEKTLNQFESFF